MFKLRLAVLIGTSVLLVALPFAWTHISQAPGNANFLCLSSASAQDNPCLPQEATISALLVENVSLQATLTSIQATMSAMSNGIPPAPANSAANSGQASNESSMVLLTDDFSDNRNGWLFSPGTSIVEGELVAVSKESQDTFVTLPGINLDSFYMEVDVRSTRESDRGNNSKWAIAFGDLSGQEETGYVKVGFASGMYSYSRSYLYVQQVLTDKQGVVRRTTPWESDLSYSYADPLRVGFHWQNGQLEIYKEGELFAIVQVTPPGGGQIALGIGRAGDESRAYFDNLELRRSK